MVAIIITHLTEQCIDTLQARSGSQARCACRATPAARMSAEGRGGGTDGHMTRRDETSFIRVQPRQQWRPHMTCRLRTARGSGISSHQYYHTGEGNTDSEGRKVPLPL